MMCRVLLILSLSQMLCLAGHVKRDKRFFYNLNNYFSKSTTDSALNNTPTTVATRNVKIFESSKSRSCGDHNINCSATSQSLDSATPASYLTPPPEHFAVSHYFPVAISKIPNPNSGVTGPNDAGYRYTTARVQPDNSESLKVKLKDVMCIKSAKNGRFMVGITTSKALPATPILENGYKAENVPQCSVTTLDSTTFQLHIQEPDMTNCGVYYCDSDVETNLMCVMIRFPLIPGIKTREDALMKVECRPQQQLVSQTRQFNIKPSPINLSSARSLPSHATITAGNPNPELHVQMGLFTQTKTGFTQPLTNNDLIAVGDDVQLRVSVRQGDGWYYSRFGQVLIHKVTSSASSGYTYGENPDSVVVIADDGCVNPHMKPVCPLGPFYDPGNPLISMMNMQVFVFNDMKDGDELTFSVTTFGCIHYEDCFPTNNLCQEWDAPRYKRSTKSKSSNITDSTAEIRLRILRTSRTRRTIKCNQNECLEVDPIVFKGPLFFSGFILISVILFAIFLIYYYSTSVITMTPV